MNGASSRQRIARGKIGGIFSGRFLLATLPRGTPLEPSAAATHFVIAGPFFEIGHKFGHEGSNSQERTSEHELLVFLTIAPHLATVHLVFTNQQMTR